MAQVFWCFPLTEFISKVEDHKHQLYLYHLKIQVIDIRMSIYMIY